MGDLDQPDRNTVLTATKCAKLAERAAKQSDLPQNQVDAAKATAIGVAAALRSIQRS